MVKISVIDFNATIKTFDKIIRNEYNEVKHIVYNLIFKNIILKNEYKFSISK